MDIQTLIDMNETDWTISKVNDPWPLKYDYTHQVSAPGEVIRFFKSEKEAEEELRSITESKKITI